MQVDFAVLRYQQTLNDDRWIPLGIVAATPFEHGTIVAVVCLQTVEVEGASELAGAILQDIPTVLRKEIEASCAKFKPGDDFLEILRAGNPWNLHFSVPQKEDRNADDILDAAMQLFYERVVKSHVPTNGKRVTIPAARRIRPQRIEMYDFSVSG